MHYCSSGLELAFYSGVYGTCIGATTHFGEAAKGLIGISGIVVGVGEIVGGLLSSRKASSREARIESVPSDPSGGGLFGLLCKNSRFRRTSVVFLGMVVHFIASYLIFLNIPADAPIVLETTKQLSPYLNPRWGSFSENGWQEVGGINLSCVFSTSVSIALLCSFLLGLGDSCFNTQLYSILGHVYAEESMPAFAIFKFIQVIRARLPEM